MEPDFRIPKQPPAIEALAYATAMYVDQGNLERLWVWRLNAARHHAELVKLGFTVVRIPPQSAGRPRNLRDD